MPNSLLNLDPVNTDSLRYQPTPVNDDRRIVHIGLGAFARAHIAALTQLANIESTEGWHISGVVRSNQALKKSFAAQGHKYLVYEKSEHPKALVVDCIDEVLSWRQDYETIMARLTATETRVVTITVTEKGYYLNHQGGLNRQDEEIRKDLRIDLNSAGGKPTATLPGLLCHAAWLRMQQRKPGLTVISCDNLSNNGSSLKSALLEFSGLLDSQLESWIEDHFNCPNTVVDCIVPKVTPEQIAVVQSHLELNDEIPVPCEPFRQWIIAGDELDQLPAWQAVGVEFVADTKPFEDRKLRILNAAHSALAYLGLLQGCKFVSDGMQQKNIHDQLISLMEEIYLGFTDKDSARAYFKVIAQRFENTSMQHALSQIGSDGSNKIPLRWGLGIHFNQKAGESTFGFANVIAAWLACWHTLPNEQAQELIDPNEDAIKSLAQTLHQGHVETQEWKSLLGIDLNLETQQQIRTAFLVHCKKAVSSA